MQIGGETDLDCVKYDAEHKACEADNNPSKRQFVFEAVSNGQCATVATDDDYDAGSDQQSRSPRWQLTAARFTELAFAR